MELGGFDRSTFYYFSLVQYVFNQHTNEGCSIAHIYEKMESGPKGGVSWFGIKCGVKRFCPKHFLQLSIG